MHFGQLGGRKHCLWIAPEGDHFVLETEFLEKPDDSLGAGVV